MGAGCPLAGQVEQRPLCNPFPMMPTILPSPCPARAHLPSSVSGSRSVKGYGDREGAGKVRRGGRNGKEKMVRLEVGVRERG